MITKKLVYQHRAENIYAIEDYERFTNILHDRFDAILLHMLNLNHKFTLITNLIDRSTKEKAQKEVMIYAGVEKQRELLEKQMKEAGSNTSQSDEDWAYLKNNPLPQNLENSATYQYFKEIQKGEFELEDIQVGILEDYFANPECYNEFQKREYPILSEVFNTTLENHRQKNRTGDFVSDLYLSLPLIQFGHFEGVVHIIFNHQDRELIDHPRVIASVIKLFSIEYESLLLDWDLVGENITKGSQIRYGHLIGDDYYKHFNTNPILRELKCKDYYINSKEYFDERIKSSNLIPLRMAEQQQELIRQYRKTAIISILIDSYAHNISAHSLTALNWLFTEKAKRLGAQKELDSLKSKVSLTEREKRLVEELHAFLLTESQNSIVDNKRPLAVEIRALLNFLLEKGAFWSGITRGHNFGGTIVSIYKVLWDFINNPLYLGTIAQTEDIQRINLHVTLYGEDEKIGTYRRKKSILYNNEGTRLSGILAHIDLSQREKTESNDGNELEEKYIELKGRSSFVQMGVMYEVLRNALMKIPVFLPGGVVGKHALFTLIENEIRNVKHYKGKALEEMQKNGLNLHLSLQAVNVQVDAANPQKELYKLGIGLEHSTVLQGSEADDVLICKKLFALQGDVMTSRNDPKLGGNYQDKICTAMLFNNEFDSVQYEKNPTLNSRIDRDEAYYPWVVTATEEVKQGKRSGIDFEVNPQNYDHDALQAELKGKLKNRKFWVLSQEELHKQLALLFKQRSAYQSKEGYLKKYVYLWRGENVYGLEETQSFEWENLSRFKFVAISEGNEKLFNKVRSEDVVRIVEGETPPTLVDAYQQWFREWFPNMKTQTIDFYEDVAHIGRIGYKDGNLEYLNKKKIKIAAFKQKEQGEMNPYHGFSSHEIRFAHGGALAESEEICNYRTHGKLMQHFFKTDSFPKAKISNAGLYELFEVLQTKICIFDKRVAGRVANPKKRVFFRKTLGCSLYEEKPSNWESVKAEGLEQFHFLVMHLSFIEALECIGGARKGKNYTEDTIGDFIRYEIVANMKGGKVPKNFILVITTGRGRTRWWKGLQDTPYIQFTTFRPIESLIASVENALQINDDIDAKFNLVKVLFGS